MSEHKTKPSGDDVFSWPVGITQKEFLFLFGEKKIEKKKRSPGRGDFRVYRIFSGDGGVSRREVSNASGK